MRKTIASLAVGGALLLAVAAFAVVGCSTTARPYSESGLERLRAENDQLRAQPANAGVSAGGRAAAPLGAPAADPDRAGGMIIYNATMHLVVERIAESLERVRSAAAALGGYLQEMGPDAIVVKVPAAKFEALLDAVGKFGEVALKEVKGADVSETMRDLAVRLKNAEEIRDRLAKLLAQAAAMDDALKIEKELERVTETVELLKGKLRYLENGVAYSTLTVRLNSPVPQKLVAEALPFPWVEGLAAELAGGAKREAGYLGRGGGRGVAFELPDGYVRHYEGYDVSRAMSADGVLLRVERHENCEGGTAEFWGRLIRRVLLERRAMPLGGEAAVLRLKTGAEARVLSGGREVGGKEAGYFLAVAADKKFVYTFEAWGPRASLAADRAKIEKAVQSLRVR